MTVYYKRIGCYESQVQQQFNNLLKIDGFRELQSDYKPDRMHFGIGCVADFKASKIYFFISYLY